MRALIIDDELNIREGLKRMLVTYCHQISHVYEANNVNSGEIAIKREQPNIVFLDVELGDGTAMDLLSKLPTINFQLIFITAHNKYAIEAFKFSAIDFLQKPIDVDELTIAVEKASKQIKIESLKEQIQVLKQNLNLINTDYKKIVLKDINSIYFIKINDIIRCESDGQYTKFYLQNEQQLLISKPLKEYENLLHFYGFIRPHHSHLVNKNKVLRFDKSNGGTIIMENQTAIPVSHRKKRQILEILDTI